MKAEFIKHENVNQDGTFTDKAGAIVTNGWLRKDRSERWFSIGMPLIGKTVEGVIIYFDSVEEFDQFINKI